MPEPLHIKQGTTRTVTVTGLRDATGAVLDPTGWEIQAVARPGIWADPVAVWRDTPTGEELLADVVDANRELDPTVVEGEKWIELHIDPSVSQMWVTWRDVNLDVSVTEPLTRRVETFHTDLHLVPTTVRT